MKKVLIALLFVSAATAAVAQERDGNSISAARELYASARYDEALALLNGLRPAENAQPSERKTIEQYRSLCLLALGRAPEAESAIAAVVTVDPFFLPTESEASPRVRTAFSDVRAKLLPGIATTMYAIAKQAYDRKEHAAAEKRFRELIAILDDPQMNGRMADMKTLAQGFLDLAAVAAAPPPPPPAPKPDPKPEPPPAPVKPKEPIVYSGTEEGIVLPMVLRQTFPNVPAAVAGMTRDRGFLELLIDEHGRVANAMLRNSIHPVYDTLLMNATKEWRYKPATLNGVPVRFKKVIQVTLPRR